MDYLTLGLIVITIILVLAAAIVLYSAKAKTGTDTRGRNYRAPRLFGVTFAEVTDELYNPNKINSAIALLWAALVFGIAAGISSAVKKTPLLTKTLQSGILGRRYIQGVVPTSGVGSIGSTVVG